MLMGVILYIDRYAFQIAQPYIRQELGLSITEFSFAVSIFFLFYGFGQMPAGWLSDRFGPRLLLTIYILVWSIFAATVGLAGSLVMLCVARAAFGLGQAGAFPTASAVVSRWMPAAQRGKASGFVALGGRIGGAVVPILSAALLMAFLPADQTYLLDSTQIIDVDGLNSLLTIEETENNPNPRYVSYLTRRLDEQFPNVTTYSLKQITSGLNHLIEDPEFYVPVEFDALKSLDKYAANQLVRLNNGEELETRAYMRLNRHLLESTLPENLQGLYVASWRPVLFLFASLGVAGALIVWFTLRDHPIEHRLVNQSELKLISSESTNGNNNTENRLPIKSLLRCRSVWMSAVSQFCVNIGWLFVVTLFVDYLMLEHRVSLTERSDMVAIPLMVGFVGMLSGGWVTDKLTRLIGFRFGRAIPWSIAMLIAASCFFLCPVLADPWKITWAMALMAFCVDFSVPSMWAFSQDVGGSYVGVVLGFGNMFGNFGAALSPILLAFIYKYVGWDATFVICGVCFVIAAIAAFFVDASRPITDDVTIKEMKSAIKQTL
ncbi:MAG: hypothetical protein CMJ76_16090 [Planctomycetaceae bacterium]|nr:hypothetical protein [Planctomycetaceae bacterium]